MDAEELVSFVRDTTQVIGVNTPLRDGFADDPNVGRSQISCLRWINYAFREMVPRGAFQDVKTETLVADQAEYTMDGTYTDITRVSIDLGQQWRTLYPTSVTRLDRDYPGWENTPSGLPQWFYFYGNTYAFYPPPNDTFDIRMLVYVLPEPLVDRVDIPTQLDIALHDMLWIGGAYHIGKQTLGATNVNDQKVLRFNILQGQWRDGKKEVARVYNARTAVRGGHLRTDIGLWNTPGYGGVRV